MALSRRTRRRLQTTFRDLLVGGCATMGLLVGLLMGLAAEPPQVPEHCAAENCLAAGLLDALLAVLPPAIGGVLVGLLVGATLAQLVRLERRPGRTASEPPADGRWIAARFPDACTRCGRGVRVGDSVVHSAAAQAVWCSACSRR